MRRADPLRMAALALVAGALLGGCARDEPDDVRPRTTAGTARGTIRPPDSAGSALPTDTAAPPDEAVGAVEAGDWTVADVRAAHAPPGIAVLRAVRVAAHDGFDRIVLDFGDASLPAYRIGYVDRPVRACGSGEEVVLPGEGWLQIELEPAAAHDDAGHATVASRDRPLAMTALRRLRSTCDFEAIVTWVAAVASPNRYRVLELATPTRLVIDVRHE